MKDDGLSQDGERTQASPERSDVRWCIRAPVSPSAKKPDRFSQPQYVYQTYMTPKHAFSGNTYDQL